MKFMIKQFFKEYFGKNCYFITTKLLMKYLRCDQSKDSGTSLRVLDQIYLGILLREREKFFACFLIEKL